MKYLGEHHPFSGAGIVALSSMAPVRVCVEGVLILLAVGQRP